MYTKGELKVTIPRCKQANEEDDDCDQYSTLVGDESNNPHYHRVLDSRSGFCGPGTAYLPHSCQEWVIGGKEEIKALIEDLQAILTRLG